MLSKINEYINLLSKYKNFDSGVLFSNGKRVENILMALDYDVSVCDYAKKNGFDTLFFHHSIGRFYYTAYKGISNKLCVIKELGLKNTKYENLVHEDMMDCFLQMRNANMIKMMPSFFDDADKQLSYVVTHHVPDYLMYEKLISLIKQIDNPYSLNDMITQLVEEINYFPKNEAVVMFTKSTYYKIPFVDICFVSSASSQLQKQLLEDGVDLLIVTSTTKEIINYAQNHGKTIILLNHIPFDYLGMTFLKTELEKKFPVNICMYEK